MNRKNTSTETNEARWLRVSLLTLTTIAPVVNSIMEYFRRRSQLDREASVVQVEEQNEAMQQSRQPAQVLARQRLDDLTVATRQRAGEQAQQLQKLAQDWSHDLRKRGEELAEEVTTQGGKISHNLIERGGKVTQDITERGSQVTQQLAKRGGKLSHDLSRRGGQLVKPLRKRNSILWTIFGFSIGMVASAVVTYLLVRKRVVEREAEAEAEQQIELPQDLTWRNGNQERQGKPMGEILHLGVEGNTMATTAAIQVVDVDVDAATPDEVPPDAVFVGIVSTKHYYPLEVILDEDVTERIYFVSEEEAKTQGYSASE
ncbi:MAG TPA: hypothetical protein DDW25_10680 [Ktedonobacter sp.]|jgi:hypothetical protein|nr:hypothetical protein [Ktedonobacter sp.]